MERLLYQNHFGLSEAPFNITPDPSFLYLSKSHREGLAQLSYGIRAKKGFVVLTGEVGTGKTTLVHALLNNLGAGFRTALIFSTIMRPVDLLRSACEEFGLIEPKVPLQEIHDYLVSLNEFLLESYGKCETCVLIIDEAQNLSAEVLESIRLLSNFETSKEKLLQILLVGQPELAVRLNSPELRQLKQRVTVRHRLRALSWSECSEYVSNRMKVAGGGREIFTATALEAIHGYAEGIPRLVNVLCDNALLTAYVLGRKDVDASIIKEVAEDLNLASTVEGRIGSIRQMDNEATIYNPEGTERVSELKSVEVRSVPGRLQEKIQREEWPLNSLPSSDCVRPGVLEALTRALADAMGPMAHIVLREKIRAIGESPDRFPNTKLESIIDSVSDEILDETMRQHFRRLVNEHIRSLPGSMG